jgi:hypothetical protein
MGDQGEDQEEDYLWEAEQEQEVEEAEQAQEVEEMEQEQEGEGQAAPGEGQAAPSRHGAPGARTPEQHALVCARMREGRLRKRLLAESQAQAGTLSAYASEINDAAMLINAELRVQAARTAGGRRSEAAFGLGLLVRGNRAPEQAASTLYPGLQW